MTFITNSDTVDRSRLRWDMEEDGLSLLPLLQHHTLRWRDTDDETRLELWLPRHDTWRRLRRENWLPFLEGIEAGLSLPEVRRHAEKRLPHRNRLQVRFIMSRVLGSLRRWGYVEFVLPKMPERLAGRYRLMRELGRGGMGVVWLAADEDADGAPVAIKHAWNGAGSLAGRDRTLREEFRLMEFFDHPGIVKAREGFEHEGRFHVVREFLDGVPLGKMDRDRCSNPAVRASITRQVAATVDHILDRGYFYLDLKPSNYFVDADGHVTLGDLGMCKPYEGNERVVRGHVGTYAYAAPEMYQRLETTEPGLVYALGVLHWQLVVGKTPKPKKHPDRLLGRLPEDLPDAERAFLHALLREAPEDRPATIADAVDLLPKGPA